MRSQSLAVLFACFVVSGCSSETGDAVNKMDPSIPKYDTLACKEARAKALDYSGFSAYVPLVIGLGAAGVVGDAAAIAIEKWRQNETADVWQSLTNACGEESVLPFMRDEAEKGNIHAQAWLGQAYAVGIGVKKDPEESAHWYMAAAREGDLAAEVNLGSFYAEGFGVAKNEQFAVFWWEQAAGKNVPQAETNLGWFYLEGRGVPQDYRMAQSLFRKAALQGHGKAQLALATMYEKGTGVPQNDLLAYEWFSMAVRNQVSGADGKLAAVATRLRDDQRHHGDYAAGVCVSSRYQHCP